MTLRPAAALALGLFTCAVPLHAAGALDPSDPADALLLNRKMTCSLEDGRPVIHWWKGTMMSRVPGERDRVLSNVQGMNIRQCGTFSDPVRGICFRSVSREVMLYLDPATDEVVRRWKNPWTGEEVEVIHVANDPVNMRAPTYARDADGKPATFRGTFIKDKAWTSGEAPLWYDNPLGGDYQDHVGGAYHAMEFGSTAASAREALDARDTALEDAVISWGRISRWLPWMQMGDRDGVVVFHTAGMRLDAWEQLPEVVRREVEANYPTYRAPPPLDDPRPNETSWTVFKKYIDARRAGEAAKQ